ncbi:MAG TPA: hypothetical protein ENO22_09960 [candidate division Zixibacteria bacterium]|nr:hypothetical protein [candidate division Zixibacteria bacterium]
MRFFIFILLSLLFACQPAVRFAGEENVDVAPDENNAGSVADNSSSGVDRGRMGKIIAGYLRTPYKNGGTGKLGLDCSGLVYVVYRDYNGTRLPINTEKLYRNLKKVDYSKIRYGDLVFFTFDGTLVSHVGIYVGNDKFVHASKSKGVIISDITEDYYRLNYKGTRRVFQ